MTTRFSRTLILAAGTALAASGLLLAQESPTPTTPAPSQPQEQPVPPAPEQAPAPATDPVPAATTGTQPAATGLPEVGTESEPESPIEAEIVLKDGRRVTGLLLGRTTDEVKISIGGVQTTFAQETIDRVRILPSVEERYRSLKESISDEDAEGLIRLARWLHDRRRYDLALREVDQAIALEPNNPEAVDLRVLIVQQQAVVRASGKKRTPTPTANAPLVGRADFPLLTDEQINLMRVFEVDLKDPPSMIIPREAMLRFLTKYAGKESAAKGPVPVTPEGRELFLRQRPYEVLSWFFDLKAREFYTDVQVRENPRSMQRFRDQVHRTWLMNNCATTKCHGGEEAGRLYLYNKQPNSDRSAYTNFLILEKFRLENGMPLIDYREPAKSPILELGLPREDAVIKHPEVNLPGKPRWKPAFIQGRDDERFRQAVDWILSMYPERTAYPLSYTPPVPTAAQQPQTTPESR